MIGSNTAVRGARIGSSIPVRVSRNDPADVLGRAGALGVMGGARIASRIDQPDVPGRVGVLSLTGAPGRLGRLGKPDGRVGIPESGRLANPGTVLFGRLGSDGISGSGKSAGVSGKGPKGSPVIGL